MKSLGGVLEIAGLLRSLLEEYGTNSIAVVSMKRLGTKRIAVQFPGSVLGPAA